MQVARPAVVPQSFPKPQHVTFLGRGQICQSRKSFEKAFEVRNDRRHLRLLQHDFADPDMVDIPATAPGKVPAMAIEPGEERTAKLTAKIRRRHPVIFSGPRSPHVLLE